MRTDGEGLLSRYRLGVQCDRGQAYTTRRSCLGMDGPTMSDVVVEAQLKLAWMFRRNEATLGKRFRHAIH
jgi:hypothetical protein